MAKKSSLDLQALEAFRQTLPEYRRNEYYTFLNTRWNIVKAHYLIHTSSHLQGNLPVQDAAKAYGFPWYPQGTSESERELKQPMLFYVDTSTVMSEQVDLSRPLILARIQGSTLVLDGTNRLYKAAQLGREFLPAYMLSEAEEKLCRV